MADSFYQRLRFEIEFNIFKNTKIITNFDYFNCYHLLKWYVDTVFGNVKKGTTDINKRIAHYFLWINNLVKLKKLIWPNKYKKKK